MLRHQDVLSDDAWKAKPFSEQDGVSDILGFRSKADVVYTMCVIALEGTEPLTAFCVDPPSASDLQEADKFDFRALDAWCSKELLLKFEALVKPKLEKCRATVSLDGFKLVRALVNVLLKGAAEQYTSADAERTLSRLPASGHVAELARNFVKARGRYVVYMVCGVMSCLVNAFRRRVAGKGQSAGGLRQQQCQRHVRWQRLWWRAVDQRLKGHVVVLTRSVCLSTRARARGCGSLRRPRRICRKRHPRKLDDGR